MTKNLRPPVQVNSLTPIYEVILSREKALDINTVTPDLLNHSLKLGFGPLLFLYGVYENTSSATQSLLVAADLSAKVLTGNQIDALVEIIRASDESVGDIILLKGMSVALSYYPEPYMRTMGDIDLLVRRSKQAELEAICFELGYIRKSSLGEEYYNDHHHGMPLFSSSKNVWVEIHTSLFPKKQSVHADYIFQAENVTHQNRRLIFNSISASCLENELELLYICVHWALELNWQKSAIRLLDVLYILNDSEIDWDRIFHLLARSPTTAKSMCILLTLLKEEQLLNLPDHRLKNIENFASGINSINLFLLTYFVRKYLLLGKKFGPLLTENNIKIIWNELLLGRFHPAITLFIVVPYKLIFPPDAEQRYSIKFQLSRIKSMFSS